MPRKTDKRSRLIQAAMLLIHRQGFISTTLADIAQEAGVPLGNVYYYFKTKYAIAIAVLEMLAAGLAEMFMKLDEKADAKARVYGYVRCNMRDLEVIARYGCPIGGLCLELGKQGGPLATQAAKLLHDIITWVEKQFRNLGFEEKSKEIALALVSNIQGQHLLTHTFRDPSIATKQTNAMLEWLSGLIGEEERIIPDSMSSRTQERSLEEDEEEALV